MEDISKLFENIFKKVAEFQHQGLNQIEVESILKHVQFIQLWCFKVAERRLEEFVSLEEAKLSAQHVEKEKEPTFESTFDTTRYFSVYSPRKTRSRAKLVDLSSINNSIISLAENTISEKDTKFKNTTAKSSTPQINVKEEKKIVEEKKRVLRQRTKPPAAKKEIKTKDPPNQRNPNPRNKLTTAQIRSRFALHSSPAKTNEGKKPKATAKLCVLEPLNLVSKPIQKSNQNNKNKCKEVVLYKSKGNCIKAIEHVHSYKENIPVLMGKLQEISKENVSSVVEETLVAVVDDKSKEMAAVAPTTQWASSTSLKTPKLDETFIISEAKKPSSIQYNFSMLRLDDSTDEEGKTSKRPDIPVWSKATHRQQALENQHNVPMKIVDKFFSVEPRSPRAQEIFPNLKAGILRRESSLAWKDHTPASTIRRATVKKI